MKLSLPLVSALFFSIAQYSYALPQHLESRALQNDGYGSQSVRHEQCTPETMSVRREWGSLTKHQREDYLNAVKCTMKTPSKIPIGFAPGSKSLYDDFIATHLNRTLFIHSDGAFLTWHRNFVYLWEQALQRECGYQGTQPYWNWPIWPDLARSPIFDDSHTSLSGNGLYDPNEQPLSFPPNLTLPRGTGGGCVVTGPFANLTLPFAHVNRSATALPPTALDYNPHCFQRSLNNEIIAKYNNQATIDQLINGTKDIAEFQSFLDFGSLGFGPHGAGHAAAGPELVDIFSSPGDPAFMLHHGMVDLTYTVWQSKGNESRYTMLSGGSTSFNVPPSANVTLDFEQDFGFLDKKWKIADLMSTTKGPFCYRYDY